MKGDKKPLSLLKDIYKSIMYNFENQITAFFSLQTLLVPFYEILVFYYPIILYLKIDTAKYINWNQSVELVMTDISLKVQGKELYLFMDEGSEATPYQLLKFYSVAKDCIRKEWRVTFASSSGCRFQADKTVCNAAANLLEHFHTREILPFTIKEAYQFLTSHQVNQKWHEEIVFSAGTVPMMLKVFVNTVTKRDFSRKLGTMTNLIELVISQ